MKEILDVCCGGKMFWFDKNHERAVYCDKRIKFKGFLTVRPNFEVMPDIQANFCNLPFDEESFSLVVFDPPHTIRNSEVGGIIAERYGRLTIEIWKAVLAQGFEECWRVLKNNGTLIFKWAQNDKSVKEIRAFFRLNQCSGPVLVRQEKPYG